MMLYLKRFAIGVSFCLGMIGLLVLCGVVWEPILNDLYKANVVVQKCN